MKTTYFWWLKSSYGGWKKSCSSWSVVYPIIYRVSTILLVMQDFAGPSTVWPMRDHPVMNKTSMSLHGGLHGIKHISKWDLMGCIYIYIYVWSHCIYICIHINPLIIPLYICLIPNINPLYNGMIKGVQQGWIISSIPKMVVSMWWIIPDKNPWLSEGWKHIREMGLLRLMEFYPVIAIIHLLTAYCRSLLMY